MSQLARILSSLGAVGLVITTGCGGMVPNDPGAGEAPFTQLPTPHPFPGPCRTPACWGINPVIPPPDYGIPEGWGICEDDLPPAIDLELWNGQSLWGTASGVVVPYYTYNTSAENPGDYNTTRWEYFGVDVVNNKIIWHAFGPSSDYAELIAMNGTYDPYCRGPKWGTGGLSSGKPPKDPPPPPDGLTGGGITIWCPSAAIIRDAQNRIAGCQNLQ
jgi:hypothetical protein